MTMRLELMASGHARVGPNARVRKIKGGTEAETGPPAPRAPVVRTRAMDLIGMLAGALEVDHAKAEGAAGGILGVMRQYAPEGALDPFFNRAPEAQGWVQKAAPLLQRVGGGADGGGLLGSVGSLFGGGAGAGGILQGSEAVQRVLKVVEGLGVPPQLAVKAVPLVLQFVREKLGSEDFRALSDQVPLFSQLGAIGRDDGGGGGGGPLGGLLGGLLK